MIIEVPGVGNVEFPDGTPPDVIERALAQYARPQDQAATQTNMLEQSMSGVNEGIGYILGAPVDIATTAINGLLTPRIETEMVVGPDGSPSLRVTDVSEQAISNPVGGSQWFNQGVLNPTISDVEPQTMAQRVGRRVGQEVGASTIPTLGLLGKTQRAGQASMSAIDDLARGAQLNPTGYLAAEAAGAVGSGVGGATAQEVAPGSVLAELLGQILGGTVAAGGMYAASQKPKAPTLDELTARQSAAYDVVDASPSQLTPEATQALQGRVTGRAASDGMDPFLAPKASRVADKIGTLDSPTISEVEKARRLVGRDVAGAVDPTERAIGMGMKDEITDYLDNLTGQDVTGGDPSATISALREGRDMTRRIKKSQDVTNRLYKAENRAATSGTGGNEVNAIRQNIRQILDNPKARRGYSQEEIAAMEDIVRGTPTQNALRMMGRFSPTAGALPAMAGVSAGAALGPFGAIPSAVGYLAKGGAEMLTKNGINQLDEMIRNGGKLAGRSLSGAQKSALAMLLAAQLANGGERGQQ